ncbi:MAG: hypothetical protein A2V70_06415 [Planctomycetes bacterium RBG_13_63_9]|nr:MAG: hypothetical protein A2V70_06415 [Planctomycetes bacterium RBG_13_63_9]
MAVYCGIWRSLHVLAGSGAEPMRSFSAMLMIWVIADGTALGGPVLLITRRVRGLRFPQYAGETLFVILGLMVLLDLARSCIVFWGNVDDRIAFLLHDAAVALLFLAATIRTKALRWRVCFGSYCAALVPLCIIGIVFYLVVPALGFPAEPTRTWLWYDELQAGAGTVRMVGALVALLCLVVAVVMDFLSRHRERYPWTHWAGIVLALLKVDQVFGFGWLLHLVFRA